jgi:hypothetical protein
VFLYGSNERHQLISSYIVIGVRVGRALHDVHVGVELLSNNIPVPSRLEDIYARIMSSYLH